MFVTYGCSSIVNCNGQTYDLQKIEVYYMSYRVHFPIAIEKYDFLKSPLTKQLVIDNSDTLKKFQQEFIQTTSTQNLGEYDPDIRVMCILYYTNKTSFEFFIDRQKFIYYNKKVYQRNIEILNIIDNYIKINDIK